MEPEKLYHEEKKEIKRITFGSLVEGILHLMDIEKGFFYTLKEFFLRPGQAIRNYFGKERYIHSNPFRTLAILAALSAFVALDSGYAEQEIMEFGQGFADGSGSNIQVDQIMQNIYVGIFEYFSLITFGFLPLIAAISYLFYRKSGFNFIEHLVINSALLLIPTLLFIISTGLFIITQYQGFLYAYYVVALIYQVYFMTSVFYKHWLWSTIKGIMITLFQYLVMILAGIVILIVYLVSQSDFSTSLKEPDQTEEGIPTQSLDTIELSNGLVEEPK